MRNVPKQKYYLGLDIGTNSVGWAVTDEDYNILKFNGKNMWGSRLFEEANTAVDRRTFRTGRRRIQRRAWRIDLLQEIFADAISVVDESFYLRMKESPLVLADKTTGNKQTLFIDDDYSDINYYAEYPTIYHLRKALLTEDKEFDVRLVYLALHHIIKHRGHFLYAGTIDNATSFETAFNTLKDCLRDEFDIELLCQSEEEISRILTDKSCGKRDKNSRILANLRCEKSKQVKAIVSLMCGMKSKLSEVFDDEELADIDKSSISFSEASYEETRLALEDDLGERCGVLDIIKGVYDWAILADILAGGEVNGKSYLSVAKAKLYDKHRDDLKIVKELLCENRKVYRSFFQKEEGNNYCAYIGYTINNGKKISIKRCSREDFIKSLKAALEKIEVNENNQAIYDYVQQEIQNDTILPLQVSKDNGVIPYQVQEMELKDILDRAERYLTFLSDKDEDGYTASEKIEKIFKFRVPYYVGPLNDYNNDNAWMVRKSAGKITPWNFEEKVDLDASAEKFIRKMTNKCTYLLGEDVVPKHSLLYEEFMVWNELNNVKIGADKLPVNVKKDVFEKIFKEKKKVSGKMLRNFLKSEGLLPDDVELSGFDGNFKSSLSSYLDFKKIFGEKINNYSTKQMTEDIILWITLYGDETKILKRVIRKKYDEQQISEDELKKVCKIKYQGWGRLSRKFLAGIEGANKDTGEVAIIIDALRNGNNNLMQLLSQNYTFSDEIEKINSENMKEIASITYENLMEDLVASPSVKRAIWQVVLVSEEIRKIMGCEPAKIFVEVARGAEEKKRTVSRKDQLISLYESCKDDEREWKAELEKKSEDDFRSIKLYLYYLQMGRCMYSGEPIDISQLADAMVYDRDHIYPQSKTKDDSLDNLVLVKRDLNAKKSDGLISSDIQEKMHGFWTMLLKKGFMSEEKYHRLMRKTPLTDEELAGFINRQLVEARQSSKLVIGLFKQIYPDADIAYVKANLVSDFRKDVLKMVKARSINDYHHAKDAYLNIVVGNVIFEKFTNNPVEWLKKNKDRNYSLNQIFNYDVKAKDKLIWQRGNEGTITTVRKNIIKRNIQYTQQAITNKGGLFNQQLVGKNDNATIEVKKGRDTSVYGGYKSKTPAFFALIESEGKKGKKQRSIEAVPLFIKEKYLKNPEKCIEYFEKEYGLIHPRIVMPQIKKNSCLVIDGFPMLLRGSTGSQLVLQCAVQMVVSEESEVYLKKIEKYIARNNERRDKKKNLSITDYDGITKEDNLKVYNMFIDKLSNTIFQYRSANPVKMLEEKKDIFEELEIEDQCIVIEQIMHLFQCKPLCADLTKIGGVSTAGKLQKSKVITNSKSTIMINYSVTGLFKQEIDLLKV